MIQDNFLFFLKKASFTTELSGGNIRNDAIAFIKETSEIWTHGQFFGITDLSELEALVGTKVSQEDFDALQAQVDGIEIPVELKNPHDIIINGTSYDGSSQVTITTPVTTIVDNLTSTSTTDALSANQGKVLNNTLNSRIDEVELKAEESDIAITAGVDPSDNKILWVDTSIEDPVVTYATTEYVNTYTNAKVSEIVNGAPATLDTLYELATALQSNRDIIATLEAAIANKANTSALSGYLPLSGGTLASNNVPLIIHRTDNTKSSLIQYVKNNESLGYIGFSKLDTPIFLNASATVSNNLIHTGNIATYVTPAKIGLGNVQNTAFYSRNANVNGTNYNMAGTTNSSAFNIYAPTTAGNSNNLLVSQGSGTAPIWKAPGEISVGSISLTTYTLDANEPNSNSGLTCSAVSATHSNFPKAYGSVLRLQRNGSTSVSTSQLIVDFFVQTNTANAPIYTRVSAGNGTEVVWGDWKTLAHTDSNVASADKLANNTAYTAWGQTFFQNGVPKSIDGHLILNNATAIRAKDAGGTARSILEYGNNSLVIGYGTTSNNSSDTYIYGNNIIFKYGTNTGEAMRINNAGNILIGHSSDSGYKLDVNGTMRVLDLATFSGGISATNITADSFIGELNGNASTATALTTSAGSATQPVYFSSGKPVACTYTLSKSVPSDAKFTDTTYSAATTSAAGLMSAADKSKLDAITASADTVSFSSSLTSGTKIGTITINGTGTDLYCQTNTNTTYTFTNGTNGFTVTPSDGSAQTVTVTPSIASNVIYSGTLVSGQVAIFDGTAGKIKASGFTIGKSVPSDAVFTDTTYSVVGTNGSTGLIKNGSSITSTSGYTACPIISGVPYYKDTNNTYTIADLMGSTTIGGTSDYLYWTGSAWGTKTLGSNAFTSTAIPTTYIKSASVSGSVLTLTPASGTAVTFTANNYSLPLAASGTRGGIQLGYAASGANIPVQLSSEKAYVTLTKYAVTSALGYTPPTTNTISNLGFYDGVLGMDRTMLGSNVDFRTSNGIDLQLKQSNTTSGSPEAYFGLHTSVLGATTSTSISGLPITHKAIFSTVSGTGTFGVTGTMSEGQEIHVIFLASDATTITLPNSGSYIDCGGTEIIELAAGEYAEVNVINIGGIKYLRAS